MKIWKLILICFITLVSFSLFGQGVKKYALGLFHFNLQYVAGNKKIQNRIIEEDLYPVLQFFEANPKYKSDIEIQGYAIKVLAEHYPEVFKLLKKLVNNGQIELVVGHYSDQFFIAYPAEDLLKSIELSDQLLKKYELKRSKVFYGQELQWTPAYASVLKGNYNIAVSSCDFDPFKWYYGILQPLGYEHYGLNKILVFVGSGKKDLGNIKWKWAFLDDGECFLTKDLNSDFKLVPSVAKENKDNYKKLLNEGYQFVTISEFVNILKNDTNYKVVDYPYVPEGTWNMDKTGGPYMWMGKQSGVDADGITRALSYQARGKILLATILVNELKKDNVDISVMKNQITNAWKELLLSEVSDSTGWTPLKEEIRYTSKHAAEANNIAENIIFKAEKFMQLGDEKVLVDTKNREISKLEHIYETEKTDSLTPVWFDVKAKNYTASCHKINNNLYQLDIKCRRPQDGNIIIEFDSAKTGLQYSAGAGERISVKIPTNLKHDPVLTLSNGYLYLGNGYSLIKDCSVEHLAAKCKLSEGKVVFREGLSKKTHSMKMRFYILKGTPEEGLNLGNQINTWPSYILSVQHSDLKIQKVLSLGNDNFLFL
ncbi:MAG: hypothetical protein GY756_07835 [bacterium]|nr:hypothetical protein [bacterium]